MNTVSIVDTSISSYNLGNEIIMDSVNSIVDELFPSAFKFRIPWEENFSRKSLRYMANSDYCFLEVQIRLLVTSLVTSSMASVFEICSILET